MTLNFMAMSCIKVICMALHYIALIYISPHCMAWRCMVLKCIDLSCMAVNYLEMYCITLICTKIRQDACPEVDSVLRSQYQFVIVGLSPFLGHCYIVVHITVIQQQNIFFSWMNRISDDSSRRIICVQLWEILYTLKKNSETKNFKNFFFFTFFLIFKNFVIRFNHEKATQEPEGKYPSLSQKKIY